MTEEEKLEHKRAVRRECNRRWMERHKEQQRASQRHWRETHKEEDAASKREWRHKNPEKVRAIVRKCFRKTVGNYLSSEFSWSEVEGFDGWTVNTEVHHRLEAYGYSMDDLKKMDRYFNCTPDELICMTKSEHASLHCYLRAIAKKNP